MTSHFSSVCHLHLLCLPYVLPLIIQRSHQSLILSYIHFHEPKLKTVQQLLNREQFKEVSGGRAMVGKCSSIRTSDLHFSNFLQIPYHADSEWFPLWAPASELWSKWFMELYIYIYIYLYIHILSIIYFKLYYIWGKEKLYYVWSESTDRKEKGEIMN